MWAYVNLYARVCTAVVEAEEGFWSLGTRVAGGCEPLEVDTGIQALVLTIKQHVHNHWCIPPAPGLLSFCVGLSFLEMN